MKLACLSLAVHILKIISFGTMKIVKYIRGHLREQRIGGEFSPASIQLGLVSLLQKGLDSWAEFLSVERMVNKLL